MVATAKTQQDLDHAKDSKPALSCNKRQNISCCSTVLILDQCNRMIRFSVLLSQMKAK